LRINNTLGDTQGYFTLSFNGETTARMMHNIDSVELKIGLENLHAISEVSVTKFQMGPYGYQWTIVWSQIYGDQPSMTVDFSNLVGTSPTMSVVESGTEQTVDGTLPPDYGSYVMSRQNDADSRCGGTLDSIEQGTCSEGIHQIQTILTEANSVLTGTYRLNVEGKRTGHIANDATAAQVKQAIEAVLTPTGRSVEVIRHAAPVNGYAWYVTFSDARAVDLMEPEDDFMVGTDAVVNVYETLVVTSGAQRDDVTGYFRLHLGNERTEWLRYDATTTQMQRALELLYGIGHVVVTREPSVNFGFVWRIICKVVTAPLHTLRAVPAGNSEVSGDWFGREAPLAAGTTLAAPWRGTGVTLTVQHPTGRVPNTYIIGAKSEVQTITVKAMKADGTDITVAGAYKLSYNDEKTPCIDWHASGATIETQLETLSGIDQVSVKRTGDGKKSFNYGYVYTITFWGTLSNQDTVQPLGVVVPGTDGCTATTNADVNTYFVHQNTLREGVADARYNHEYVSLREQTNYQARVTALNVEGYGFAGVPTPLTTPEFGIEPDAPESLSVAKRYTGDSFSVDYNAPERDGGDLITKYRIEWDTVSTFGSANFDHVLHEAKVEIQEVITSFKSIDQRGGTFNLKWGGQVTDELPWDCAEDVMSAQLQLITGGGRVGINPIEVERNAYGNGIQWLVTFHHGWGDMQILKEDFTLLKGYDPKVTVNEVQKGNRDIVPGQYTFEQQTIRTSALSAIGGEFQLEFEGHLTSSIPFNANRTHMKLAMEELTTIYTVNVEVQDSYNLAQQGFGARTWTVTFSHLFHESIQGAGDIGLLIPRYTSLTGNNVLCEVETRVVGTNPLEIDITSSNILIGSIYYVRVAAFNSRGFGPWSQVVSGIPRQAPGAPMNVVLKTESGTSLKSSWTTPTKTGGAGINNYKVQWYTANGIPEVQMVTTSAGPGITEIQRIVSQATIDNIYGFFTLTFRGETTKSISHEATAADVKEALELMTTVGTVLVTRTLSKFPMPGIAQAVQGQNFVTVTVDPASFKVPLLRGHLVYVAGEVFRVSTDVGRTFDATTIPLSLESNAATPATFAGETVASMTYYRWAYGYEWTVEFNHGHVGDQPTILALPSVRPGEGWDGEKVTLNTIVDREGLQPVSGTFRLSYKGHTTRRLAYNTNAIGMSNALTSLIDAGPIDVTRIPNGNGYNWIITFMSDLGDLPQVHPNDVQLTGPSAKMSSATRIQGVAPTNVGSMLVNAQVGKVTYEYIIPNLIQGTPYMCRITASNSEGYGAHATSTPFVQVPKQRPPVPKKADLIVLTDTMLKIVIHKPVTNGGAIITKYLIEWDTSSTFNNVLTSGYRYVMSDLTMGTPYYYNVPNLVAGTKYYFRVSAYNDQGYGPTLPTNPPFAAPATRVPGLPLSTTVASLSNFEIQVDWTIPSQHLPLYGGDGGRPITHYLIEWDTDYDNLPAPSTYVYDMTNHQATNTLTHIVGYRDPMTGVTLSELDGRESEYLFRITAYNADGYGNATWVTPKLIRPVDRIPFPPSSMTASATSGTTIATTWQMPLHDGGKPIERFQLEWDTSNKFTNTSNDFRTATLPVTTETQSFSVRSKVLNEVQTIGATVGVINERQQFQTKVVGVNEIQTITTHAKPVVPEIQTVTTYATDHNEIQILKTTARNVDEVQSIRSDIPHVDEIQIINITATDEDEVQRITISEPRNTQVLKIKHSADTQLTHQPTIMEIRLLEPMITQDIVITPPVVANNPQAVTVGSFKITYGTTHVSTSCIDYPTINGDWTTGTTGGNDVIRLAVQEAITFAGIDPTGTTVTSVAYAPAGSNTQTEGRWITINLPNIPLFESALAIGITHTGCTAMGGGATAAANTNTWGTDPWGTGAESGLKFKLSTGASCVYCKNKGVQETGFIYPGSVQGTSGSLKTELEALSGIGAGKITVVKSPGAVGEGYVWTVTFSGDTVMGNVPILTISSDLNNADLAARTAINRHRIEPNLATIGSDPKLSVHVTQVGKMGGFKLARTNDGATVVNGNNCIGWDSTVTGGSGDLHTLQGALIDMNVLLTGTPTKAAVSGGTEFTIKIADNQATMSQFTQEIVIEPYWILQTNGDPITAGSFKIQYGASFSSACIDYTKIQEWTLAVLNSPVINELAGVTVTQGTATGTLKTALTGATSSVVIQTAAGVTFIGGVDVMIGTTNLVLADIQTATNSVDWTTGTTGGNDVTKAAIIEAMTAEGVAPNEWTLAIDNAPVISELAGVTVTQGAATGTLKTALSGATTSVVIETAAGVTFLNNADVTIGVTPLVQGNINTATMNAKISSVTSAAYKATGRSITVTVLSFFTAVNDIQVSMVGCTPMSTGANIRTKNNFGKPYELRLVAEDDGCDPFEPAGSGANYVVVDSSNLAGSFTLGFDTRADFPETTCQLCPPSTRGVAEISSAITPTTVGDVKTQLELLAQIDLVHVVRVALDSNSQTTIDEGYTFDVIFAGLAVSGNVPLLSRTSALTGDAVTISIETSRQGNQIDLTSTFVLL
jgi:hypothetical protein